MDSAPPDRQAALRALTSALSNLVDACERMQLAAVWVLEGLGSEEAAETVRMLPVYGSPDRSGRPAVPPAPAADETVELPVIPAHPVSVTGDES